MADAASGEFRPQALNPLAKEGAVGTLVVTQLL
jgi:hypothetical protein